MENTKDQLLKELSTMIHLSSNRKIRSDAGKARKPQIHSPQSKVAIYNRVRARIRNKDNSLLFNGDSPVTQGFDENGFYLFIPESYINKNINYKQIYQGRTLEHTTRRVRTQKGIDLEQYRFEAWQEMATSQETKDNIVGQSVDLNGILMIRYGMTPKEVRSALERRQLTYYDLFKEIYFVDEPEEWNYETWRKHYDCCPREPLPEDFRFNRDHLPGTPEFMPEWQYRREKLEQENKEAIQIEQERKSQQFITNMQKRR